MFAIGGSRQSAILQMGHHEDSSGHHSTVYVSARLQTQGFPDNVCPWISSTHRVLTATLCNESKRKRISVPSLDQRPLKLLKNSNEQPTEPSKPLPDRLGSLLPNAGDRRLRRQRRSQDSHIRAGQACLAIRQASSMGPHDAGVCGGGRESTDDVLASSSPSPWVVGPTDNTHDWTVPIWYQTLAEYRE